MAFGVSSTLTDSFYYILFSNTIFCGRNIWNSLRRIAIYLDNENPLFINSFTVKDSIMTSLEEFLPYCIKENSFEIHLMTS